MIWFHIVVIGGAGALIGMILADYIHEWKTGTRIRDCGEQKK